MSTRMVLELDVPEEPGTFGAELDVAHVVDAAVQASGMGDGDALTIEGSLLPEGDDFAELHRADVDDIIALGGLPLARLRVRRVSGHGEARVVVVGTRGARPTWWAR